MGGTPLIALTCPRLPLMAADGPPHQVWPQLEAAEALVVAKQRGPKLRLAQPPACGIRPLALQAADVAHALGSAPILRGVEMEVR